MYMCYAYMVYHWGREGVCIQNRSPDIWFWSIELYLIHNLRVSDYSTYVTFQELSFGKCVVKYMAY